jgi:hypothetical protein
MRRSSPILRGEEKPEPILSISLIDANEQDGAK